MGKVRDVLVVYRKNDPPLVVGLIVEIPGKRRVFVSIGRVTSIGSGQIITTGLINVRRFEQRGGEVRVIAEMLGRTVVFNDGSGEATIEDVSIEELPQGGWAISQLFVRRNEGERVDRATAAGEEVDRPTDLRDDPMQVISVLPGIRLARRIDLRAALGAARVVGDDRPIGEVAGERAEAGGAQR